MTASGGNTLQQARLRRFAFHWVAKPPRVEQDGLPRLVLRLVVLGLVDRLRAERAKRRSLSIKVETWPCRIYCPTVAASLNEWHTLLLSGQLPLDVRDGTHLKFRLNRFRQRQCLLIFGAGLISPPRCR